VLQIQFIGRVGRSLRLRFVGNSGVLPVREYVSVRPLDGLYRTGYETMTSPMASCNVPKLLT
jgi:hypothetical protein